MNRHVAGPTPRTTPSGPSARPLGNRHHAPDARTLAKGPRRAVFPRRVGAALLHLLLLPWHPACKDPVRYAYPRPGLRPSPGRRAATALLTHHR